MARTPSLRLVGPEEEPPLDPVVVDVPNDEIAPGVTLKDGVLHAEHEDGSVTVDLDPKKEPESGTNTGHYENLVDKLDESELAEIASELLDGIQRDIDSRKDWLETRAKGIKLLGLQLEEPRGDTGASTAALEGISSVRHPLLLEAVIRFQATARGELLPATGPVKIRNDTPMKSPSQKAPESPPLPPVPETGVAGAGIPPSLPGGVQSPVPAPLPPPGMGHNGPPEPMSNPAQDAAPTATELAIPPTEERDSLAAALELDFNHYLTVTATEYVPDTDRMLFNIGFGGDSFKKVYNCPLRRRPVSESVDAEHLIVSNAATDLQNCGRVTHHIRMRKSVVRRMQILGAYRDVELDDPTQQKPTAVSEATEAITGVTEGNKSPEDLDYSIYESACELDLDQFAPEKFKGKGLPLPYRVTVEEKSKKILAIVRNWEEDDEEALPEQYFVQFPFIRGLTFYGLGFLHILGNTTTALTAMWRLMLDGGMFGNFPGFLYAQGAGRQMQNQFRIPPGGGQAIQVPATMRIQDAVMPLPYKEPGAAFGAFAKWVEEAGQRLGQTADINIGEGKQDAPVGTTLALIEQSTKMLDSVHKRLHWAQSEEFALLKKRFQRDPEAFWRHNPKAKKENRWQKDQFLKALEDYNLVPVADPNNPTSLHRTAKAAAIEGLLQKYPQLLNQKAGLERVFRVAGIDAEGLFYPQPLPPPPDPRMEAIKVKQAGTDSTNKMQQETATAKAMSQVIISLKQLEDKQQDRASKEQLQKLQIMFEAMKHDAERQDGQQELMDEAKARQAELQSDLYQRATEIHADRASKMQELHTDRVSQAHEIAADAHGRRQELGMQRQEHAHDMEKSRREHAWETQRKQEEHQQKMAHQKEMHKAELAQARALARAKPKSDSKKAK